MLTQTSPTFVAPTTDRLTFRLITDPKGLVDLAPTWQELLDASTYPEPMLAPNWLLPWWRIYGQDRELRVGLFHDRDHLVGIAPMCSRRYKYRPGIPFRRLEPLGADVDEQDGVCSAYLGLIARTGQEDRIARAFADQLRAGGFGPWDEFVMSAMDGSSQQPVRLAEALRQAGISVETTESKQAPYVTLPATWDDYLRGLKKSKRHHLNQAWRDFETWSERDYRIERATNLEELERGRRILESLHAERWQGEGAFTSPRFTEFHRDVLGRLFANRQLELSWLLVKGEPVAVHYSFVVNNKVYLYQCGRRLDVAPRARVGIAQVILAMKAAIAAGRREFDFLGEVMPYKMMFTADTRPIVQVRGARPCVVEWARRAARAGRARWRSLIQRTKVQKNPKLAPANVNQD